MGSSFDVPLHLAEWIVRLLAVWLATGLLVGISFVLIGVRRSDPAAHRGTWGFRLLILPGAVALWPLVLRRWVRGDSPPTERTPHRRAR